MSSSRTRAFFGRKGRAHFHKATRGLVEAMEKRVLMSAGGGFTGAGVTGSYYSNATLSGSPGFTRVDDRVDFNFGTTGAPGGSPDPQYSAVGAGGAGWSAEWVGSFVPRYSETYTFSVTSEGAARLYVVPSNQSFGSPLINNFTEHTTAAVNTGTFALTAGNTYNIKLDYETTASTSASEIKLQWSGPSTALEDIEPAAAVGLNVDGGDSLLANMVNGATRGVWWGAGNTNVTVATDANQWPTGDAEIFLGEGDTSLDSGGTYLVQFTGTATLGFQNFSATFHVGGTSYSNTLPDGVGYNSATGLTTATIVVSPGSYNGFILKFTNTSREDNLSSPQHDGITNLYVMQPTTLGGSTDPQPGTLFTAAAQTQLSQYTTLRAMGLLDTNGTIASNWSDRTTVSDEQWNGWSITGGSGVTANTSDTLGTGLPWEVIVALANETGKDVYINIPSNASLAYIHDVADLFAYGSNGTTPYTSVTANPIWAPLNSNLKVYIEFSNEIWNFGFTQAGTGGNGWINQISQRALYDYLENIQNDPQYPGGGANGYNDGQVISALYLPGGASNAGAAAFEATYNGPTPAWPGYGSPQYFSNADSALPGYTIYQGWVALRLEEISTAFKSVLGENSINADSNSSRVRPVFEWQYGGSWDGELAAMNTLYGASNRVGYYLYGGGGGWYSDDTYNGFGDSPFTNGNFTTPVVSTGNDLADPTGSGWTFNNGSVNGSTAGITTNGSDLLSNFTQGIPNLGPDNNPTTDGQTAYLEPGSSISQSVNFSGGWADITLIAGQTGQAGSYNYGLTISVDGKAVGESEGALSFSGSDNAWTWDRTAAFNVSAGAHTITFTNTWNGASGVTVFVSTLGIQTINGLFSQTASQGAPQPGSGSSVKSDVKICQQYGLLDVGYEGGFDFNQNLDGGDSSGQGVYQNSDHVVTDGYAEMGSKGYSTTTPNVALEANLDPRTVQLAENTMNTFYADGGTLPIAFQGNGNVNSWAIAAPTYFNTNTPKQQAVDAIESSLPTATTYASTYVPNTIYPSYKSQDYNDSNGAMTSYGWIDWNITVPVTGTYIFTANTTSGGSYRLSLMDDITLGTGTTGGTIDPSMLLYPGQYTLKLEDTAGAFNVSQIVISEANAPTAPVITRASMSNAGLISVSWNASTGATGYLLGYGPTAGQYTTFIDEGSSLSGAVTVPNPSLVYHAAIYAYNSSNAARSLPSADVRLALPSTEPSALVNFQDQTAHNDLSGAANAVTEPLVESNIAFTSFGNSGGTGLFVIGNAPGYYQTPTSALTGGYWGTNQQFVSATTGQTFDLYSLDLYDWQGNSAIITGTDISGGTLVQVVNLSTTNSYGTAHQVLDWTDLTKVQVTWWSGIGGTGSGRTGAITNLVFNDVPPTITSATANPATVSGVSTTLSATAADTKNPVSGLIYSWAATTVPGGAVAPIFSDNNNNSAHTTTACFSAAGNYVFTVTATDAEGLFATQTIPVTVSQTETGWAVAPGVLTVTDGSESASLPTPVLGDQFGASMGLTQPSYTWAVVSGPVTLAGQRHYNAPATGTGWSYLSVTGGGYTNIIPSYYSAAGTPNFYNGFSSGALTTAGSASIASAALDLTTANGYQAGAAWYGTPLSDSSFVADFAFQISNQAPASVGGNGITFTIQNDAITAVGSNQTGLGYQGITNSVALKFDLVPWDSPWNSSTGVGNEELDSIGVFTDGAAPTTPATDLSMTGIQLRSGDVFKAHVTYDGTNLDVTLTDETNILHPSVTESYPVNIPSIVGADTAYFGFTGGTTQVPAGSSQNVLWWTYGQPQTSFAPVANQSGGISSVTLDSTRPLVPFNVSNLSLTDNGQNVSLNTAQISTNDGGLIYTISNLAALTATSGSYVFTAPAAGLTDFGGNNPSAKASVTWNASVVGGPLNLTGSNYLELDGNTGGQLDVWTGTANNGSPASTHQLSQITTITDAGTAGNDTLTINFTNGNPLSATTPGINFDTTGTTGGTDSVILIGDNHGDTYNVSATQVLFSGGSGASAFTGVPINLANVNSESVQAGTGPDALSVSGGVTLGYTAPAGGTYPTAQLSSIAITSGSKVIFSSPNPTRALLELNTATTWAGQLNLKANDMLIHGGSSAYNTINGLVATGYASGAWTGAGIISSTALANTTHLTTLGTVLNTAGISFDGVSALATDVLVKYTYYGDTNLDGTVHGGDFTRIDNGYLNHLIGWNNGDFNYDGVVNGSDYTLIDNAFNAEGGSLAAQIAGPAGLASPAAQVSHFAASQQGSNGRAIGGAAVIRSLQDSLDGSYAAESNPSSNNSPIAEPPTDLVDNRLSGSQIMMADSTVWIGGSGSGGWCFNHAVYGNAGPIFDSAHGTIVGNQSSITACRGMNELFGDGHVVWRPMTSVETTKLAANPADVTVPQTAWGGNFTPTFLYFY